MSREKIMGDICQSCKQAPVEVVEKADDPQDPYEVCQDCHHRLMTHSLRPREWYNLASVHGMWETLLDSEFYDQDGKALQPEEEMSSDKSLPCPTFDEVESSPEKLISYIYSRNHSFENEVVQGWHIDDKYIDALKRHSPGKLLPAFSKHLNMTKNGGMINLVFELCARSLGPDGAEFVRENWAQYAEEYFEGASLCAYKCFPLDEGFKKVTDILSKMDERKLSRYRSVLEWFRTSQSLDWIEENIKTPVDFVWGNIAVKSGFNWSRAKKWLDSGRPLSLVALDALVWCICDDRKPPLLNPPSSKEFTSVLEDYLNKDNVPRVREKVNELLGFSQKLTNPTRDDLTGHQFQRGDD